MFAHQSLDVTRFPNDSASEDQIAVEEPVEIRIDGEPLAVTMRTPGDDAELAAGFCLTEGVIDHPDEIERVEPCNEADYGNVVLVSLSEGASRRFGRESHRRELYLSSSCGLCGTRTLDRLEKRVTPIGHEFTVSPEVLIRLPDDLGRSQETFARTGGLHAAGLFTTEGRLRLAREDVGRHNAVDKLIGGLLLSGQLPPGPFVLLVSGRASFELIQKSARAGVGFFAAVGAPSSLAVEAAARFGITLVGFLRGGRFNVYTGADRIA